MADSRKPMEGSRGPERGLDEARRRYLRKIQAQSWYDAPAVSTIPLIDDRYTPDPRDRPRRG